MFRNQINEIPIEEKVSEKSAPTLFYIIITITFVAIIASGLFLVAKQQLAIYEIGIKKSNLKKQMEELEAEQRRLLAEREIARSPVEIKKAALRMGFRESNASLISYRAKAEVETKQPLVEPTVLKLNSKNNSGTKITKDNINIIFNEKTGSNSPGSNSRLIQKTALSSSISKQPNSLNKK
ncbi:MAG TPA: hypothetical protein VNK26_07450 [Pyrinomonadaceae bacterium]|nr:hypothetical protein [Pyrinomonadaceae bacterium]